MVKINLATRAALLAATILGCTPVAALAQVADSARAASDGGSLEDIIVTARRREENLQSVPVTITAITPQQLDRAGSRNIADLVQVVPGLTQTANADRNNIRFGIRGQQFTFGTLFPAVVAYFAEVPLQRISDGQFFDIGNVQVLKGPQGTLFGRVTDGGAILLSPNRPGAEFGGYAQAKVGTYDLRELEGAINVPLVGGKLMMRVAGNIIRRDGYTKNLFSGDDLDDVSSEAVRVGLLFRPTDGIENYTVLNYNHSHTNGTATVLVDINPLNLGGLAPAMQAALEQQRALGPRRVNEGAAGPLFVGDDGIEYRRKALWIVNTTTIDLADNTSLKNIFGYQNNTEPLGGDFDGTLVNLNQNPNSRFLPDPNRHREQFSNELQLQGNLFDGTLDYTFGLYGDHSRPKGKNENFALVFAAQILSSSQYAKTNSRAAYGQVGLRIADGLKLNAGIRYTHDNVRSRDVAYSTTTLTPESIPHGECRTSAAGLPAGTRLTLPCVPFRQSSSVVTYTLGLDYQVAPDMFAYASLRRGYRPGGINSIQRATTVPGYGPEYVKSHEVGLKADWHIGPVQLRTNLAGFYDVFTDIQRSQTVVPPPPDTPYSAIVNVPRATIKGLEADVTLIPVESVTVHASWAYLDAKYDAGSFNYSAAKLAAACPVDPQVVRPDPTTICPSYPLPLTPKHTLQADIRWTLPFDPDWGTISIGGDMYYTSSSFAGGRVLSTGIVPAYTLFNANLVWKSVMSSNVDLTVFVNNMTDKVYYQSLSQNLLDRGNFGIKTVYYGPPRMAGISLRYHFGGE